MPQTKESGSCMPYKIEAGEFSPDYFVRTTDKPRGVRRLVANLRNIARQISLLHYS
ncbi:hypothetical protein HYU94_01465 [Candidatus Daviesbacteria bacterium]|nr:hypothetical protein [Candidatus Daviesbacteria bacterium]